MNSFLLTKYLLVLTKYIRNYAHTYMPVITRISCICVYAITHIHGHVHKWMRIFAYTIAYLNAPINESTSTIVH